MKLTKDQIEEIINDQGNTLFGVSFPNILRILYEYQTHGIDAGKVWERIRLLEHTIRELLKGGEHDGDCFEGYSGLYSSWEIGPCIKHLAAAEAREKKAREVLGK